MTTMTTVMTTIRIFAVCALGALLCSACVTSSFPVGPASLPVVAMQAAPASAPIASRSYLLQSGDAFDVKLFYTPELNESVVVRPDGKISLQLVGEVQAAGHSPGEIEQELHSLYAKALRNPAVTVVVKQFKPQQVFVSGEVRTPGAVVLQDDMTALQAIAHAGFFTRDAEARNVVVLRYKGSGGPEFILLDMKAMMDGEHGTAKLGNGARKPGVDPGIPKSGDVMLQPMDVVFVPQSHIASVADFFNRYVNNIIPLWRNLGFSMVYYTNNARVVTP